jgi:hypothetical protein
MRCLSPAPAARAYNSPVVCCDGTWMGPSCVHVQTAGAWKESGMAQDPGDCCVGYRRAASNGASEKRGSRRPPCQPRPLKERSSQGRGDKLAAAPTNAERGCRKATRSGRETAPLWLRSRHPRPVAPSPALPAGLVALAACARRECRFTSNAKRPSRSAISHCSGKWVGIAACRLATRLNWCEMVSETGPRSALGRGCSLQGEKRPPWRGEGP